MSKKSPLVASALALAVSSAFAQSTTETTNSLYQLASLDPVVVSASRYEQPLSATNVIVSVIDRSEIEKSGVSNVVEYLDQIPGVSVSRIYGRMGNDARVDIGYLGENSGTNVLVLIDGFRVNNIDGETVRFSQIPISSIERIEVRTAGAGVLYGDRAMGGVINIITRQEADKSITTSLGSFGYKKLDTYLASKNNSQLFNVSAMYAESDGYRDRTKSDHKTVRFGFRDGSTEGNFWSIQLRAFDEYAQLPGGIPISTFNENAKKALNYSDDGKRSGEQISMSLQKFISNSSKYVIGLAYESSKNDAYIPSNSWGDKTNKRETKKTSFQPMLQLGFTEDLTIIAGLDAFSASIDVNGDYTGKSHAEQTSIAIFGSAEKKISPNFSTSLGLRRQGLENKFERAAASADGESREYLNAYSLGFSYFFNNSTKMRFGFVDGYRFPTTDELYFFDKSSYVPTRIYTGVKAMTTEEIYMIADHKYASGSLFGSFRAVETKGEIGFSSGAQCSPASVTEDCNRNLYDTRRYIVTAGIRHQLDKKVSVSASADLVDSEIRSGSGQGKEIPLVPSRVFRLGLETSLLSGLMALNINYRGDMYQSEYYESYAVNDSGYRIPSRTLVDLGYLVSESKALKWNIWLRNLADKKYYDFGRYGSSGGVYPGDGRAVEASLTYSF